MLDTATALLVLLALIIGVTAVEKWDDRIEALQRDLAIQSEMTKLAQGRISELKFKLQYCKEEKFEPRALIIPQ